MGIPWEILRDFLIAANDLQINGLESLNSNHEKENLHQAKVPELNTIKRGKSPTFEKIIRIDENIDDESEHTKYSEQERNSAHESNSFNLETDYIQQTKDSNEEGHICKKNDNIEEEIDTENTERVNVKGANEVGILAKIDREDLTSSDKENSTSETDNPEFFKDECTSEQNFTEEKVKRRRYLHKKLKCNLCDHRASHSGNLKVHMLSKHMGSKFSCDQCTFTSTYLSALRGHIRKDHENVRYPCDHCEFNLHRKTT